MLSQSTHSRFRHTHVSHPIHIRLSWTPFYAVIYEPIKKSRKTLSALLKELGEGEATAMRLV